jgi:hypothetical protein
MVKAWAGAAAQTAITLANTTPAKEDLYNMLLSPC